MWQRFIIFIMLCGELAVVAGIDIDENDPEFTKTIKQSLDDELEYFRFKKDDEDPFMGKLNVAEHDVRVGNVYMSALQNISQVILTYEKRSLKKGKDSIQSIAICLEQSLKVSHDDLSHVTKKMISDYIFQTKRYFSKLNKVKPDSDVDKEYIVLDMVNVVSLISRDVEKLFFDKTIALSESDSNNEVEILLGTLVTFNDFDKRQETDFVCEQFIVCRPNPSFSGYVFKLLDEILNVNDDKFHYFLIKSSKLLLNNQSFFETILGIKIIKWFKSKMENIATTNVAEIRKAAALLRSTVIRRYNINDMKDKQIQFKTRSKATIVDIVDVAFGIDGDAIYGPQMEKMITEVKDWRGDFVRSIEVKLEDTIKYIIEALNLNLTTRGRKEIMALADIIFYNKSEDVIERNYLYLMTQGSKFVQGLIQRKELKKLW